MQCKYARDVDKQPDYKESIKTLFLIQIAMIEK